MQRERERVEERQEFKSSREPKKKHANVQRSEETVGKEVEPRVYRVAVIFQFVFTLGEQERYGQSRCW